MKSQPRAVPPAVAHLVLVRPMKPPVGIMSLAAFVLAGCSTPPHQLAAPAQFYGRVVFAPTGAPLANVLVKLERPDQPPPLQFPGPSLLLATTRTDSSGRFVLTARTSGPYDIVCFRPGPHAGSGARDVHPNTPILIQYRPEPIPHP